MATAMIIFAAKAYNISSLVSSSKATLNNMADPFLCLIGDRKLQAINKNSSVEFGSQEDDISCLKSLSEISRTENRTRESFIAEIVESLGKIKDDEIHAVKEQLISEFSPDYDCPMGAHKFEPPPNTDDFDSPTSTSHEFSGISSINDVDSLSDTQQSQELLLTRESRNLLSADQLLESVLETAQQVSRFSVSDSPEMVLAYKELANHCETRSAGKHQKMSHLMVTQSPRRKPNNAASPSQGFGSPFHDYYTMTEPDSPLSPVNSFPSTCGAEMQNFKLPTSCPYDNFLKAADS